MRRLAFSSTAPNDSDVAPPVRVPTWLAFAVWAFGAALPLTLLVGAVAREEVPSIPDAPPPPTLTPVPIEQGRMEQTREHLCATLPWENAHSLWGWGNVRFSAEPRLDEIGVITIVDAPRTARVWTSPCEVRLEVDGEVARVRAEPVGSRMKTGDFFDAIRMEIGIDVLRRMAHAREVHGDLCGEPFALPSSQRETLRGFVEAFDGMAMPRATSNETEVELAPVDPDEVIEDPDLFLEAV
jgi:hypothetical protein